MKIGKRVEYPEFAVMRYGLVRTVSSRVVNGRRYSFSRTEFSDGVVKVTAFVSYATAREMGLKTSPLSPNAVVVLHRFWFNTNGEIEAG